MLSRACLSAKKMPASLIMRSFHWLYYRRSSQTWMNSFWMGVRTLKCPLDLWIYQEVLHETRPELIVETGTSSGGSALYLGCLCDLFGRGEIVSIDIEEKEGRPKHERVTYLNGSSTSPEIIAAVRKRAEGRRTMVILDSDHSRDHVLRELEAYAPLVSSGCYLIVEDTNINGHPVKWDFGPGPLEAVRLFLRGRSQFEVDLRREKFMLTFNPYGFLLRR